MNSLIAAAGRGGVDVLLNGNSQRQNPSMVGFDKCRAMGEAASMTYMSNYRNTISCMKRLVGLSFHDPKAKREMALLPFECFPIPHPQREETIGVSVPVQGEQTLVGIEHVAGMLVRHMGTIAAASQQLQPQDWVVGIPAYYTDAQRRALIAGCEAAGIPKIQRLMHETTATALAYGIFKDIKKEFANQEKPTNVMFIDMGATAFQVAVVAFEPGKLSVKSSQCDENLGGRDFDAKIADWIATQFEQKYKNKVTSPVRQRKTAWLKVLAAAEKAKKTLSPAGVKEVRINVECLADDLDFGGTLQASEYEQMCQPLLDRLQAPIARALEEAKITAKCLSSVEIVGGSTRIGCVKRTLAHLLGLDTNSTNNGLSTTLNADESVARGAALQSAILSPRFKVLPYEIIEFQTYPIQVSWDGEASTTEGQGVEIEEGADGSGGTPTNSVIMFERGSNFPSVRRVTLRRQGNFEVRASYHNTEGIPSDITTFMIQAPVGNENKVRINVKQDISGTLTLSSAQMVEEVADDEAPALEAPAAAEIKEGETKEEAPVKKKVKKTNLQFHIHYPIEWSKAEIEAAYELEVKMSNSDRIVKETSDKRNELESYLYEMRDKVIGELREFAPDSVREKFSAALESTENWLYEDGFDAVKSVYQEKLNEVRKIGDPIVARFRESSSRPNAVKSLQDAIEQYRQWLYTVPTDENLAHITSEEQEKCHAKCDEISGWIYDLLDQQGSLSNDSDPVLKVEDITAKLTELHNVVAPVTRKPKPIPPKLDEKKKEEESKASENGNKKHGEGAAPMETDDTTTPEAMDTTQ
jgi:heat shock protein 4